MSELPWPREWCEPQLTVTIKSNCGKIHSSFEEWQKCYACGPVLNTEIKDLNMAEKIRKTYTSTEMKEALKALEQSISVHGSVDEYSIATLKNLYSLGYRLVKIPK